MNLPHQLHAHNRMLAALPAHAAHSRTCTLLLFCFNLRSRGSCMLRQPCAEPGMPVWLPPISLSFTASPRHGLQWRLQVEVLEKSLARQTDLQRAGMIKGQLHSKQHEVRAEGTCSCLPHVGQNATAQAAACTPQRAAMSRCCGFPQQGQLPSAGLNHRAHVLSACVAAAAACPGVLRAACHAQAHWCHSSPLFMPAMLRPH